MKKIIITSPGGGGKNHLVNFLKEKDLSFGISYCTRPKRESERDGVDYHFISEEDFTNMVLNDEFLEFNRFKDWWYGTSYKEFESKDVFIMTPNVIPLLDRKSCFIVYLNIPEEVRRRRLTERRDKNDEVERRLETDRQDFKGFTEFDLEVKDENFSCSDILSKIML